MFVAIAIASASALLAGCGGGDSSRNLVMDLETDLAAQQERVAALEDELDEALAAAEAAAAAAATKIEALEMAQSEAAQQFTAAQADAEEMIDAERLKVTNLQSELQTAQSDLEAAETEYEMVVEEKEAAERLASDRAIELANQERDLRIMIAEYKGQVTLLQGQLDAALPALAKAKEERDEAIAGRREAERLAAAEQSEVEAELVVARQDIIRLQDQLRDAQDRLGRTDAERDQIADERDDAVERANRADARDALGGDYAIGTAADPVNVDIAAPVRYRESATVTAPTDTFAGTSTSTTGQWLKTTLSNRGSMTAEQAEIYSDVDAPENILFADSKLNTGTIVERDGDTISGGVVVDSTGKVVGWIPAGTLNMHDASASAFPRTSGAPMQIRLIDRGEFTQAELDEHKMAERDRAPADDDVYDSRGFPVDPDYDRAKRARDEERYPEHYSVEVSGSLDNASGRFVCGGNDPAAECTVQNTGEAFDFSPNWRFQPSSSSQRVRVPDAHYMWFGWWSQQPISDPDGEFAYRANHGGTIEVSDVSGVTGKATYKGVASGQYAIYQPLGEQSSHGRFNANATLTADFDANTVSGAITEFSQQPDWSLTLHSRPINGGQIQAAEGSVSWLINGIPRDGAAAAERQWEAQFYSNIDLSELDPAPQTRVRPYGIAGAFTATYTDVGKMVGAFGAHAPQ